MVQLHSAEPLGPGLNLCQVGWYRTLYYTSWLLFGLVALGLNLLLAPLLLLPRRRRPERLARRAIQGAFGLWLQWLHVSRLVQVRWHGFEREALPGGVIYVANHPTLVDATFLLARLPDAACIFKAALLRNPVLAPAARLAGYVPSGQGLRTVRGAADRVARGQPLLVFPEGTRTRSRAGLNPLKRGFILMAQRAQAPLQLIHLRASPDLVPWGRPWWQPPTLPAWVEITKGERLPPPSLHVCATQHARAVQRRLEGRPEPRVAAAPLPVEIAAFTPEPTAPSLDL